MVVVVVVVGVMMVAVVLASVLAAAAVAEADGVDPLGELLGDGKKVILTCRFLLLTGVRLHNFDNSLLTHFVIVGKLPFVTG